MNQPKLQLKTARTRPFNPALAAALQKARSSRAESPAIKIKGKPKGPTNGKPKGDPRKAITDEEIRLVREAMRWSDVPLPRAIGIEKPVRKALAGKVANSARKRIVYKLVRSLQYLQALAAKDSRRYAIDGTDAGPVSQEHRDHARALLKGMKKKCTR